MKIVLVYISPNTTTQKISNELSNLFLKDHHDVVELNIGEKENRNFQNVDFDIFEDADIIGIGSPVYHMKIMAPLSDFLKYSLPKIRLYTKIKSFIYLTYGGITTGKAFINTANLLRQNDIKVIGGFKVKAPHFWHVENFPDDESINTVNSFYSTISGKNFSEIEWNKIEKMFSYQKPIIKILYPMMGIVSNLRKQNIKFDHDKCIKCKKCSNECPVNAIEIGDYPIKDKDRCIYCYHCTTLCPKDAVICNVNEIKEVLKKNKKVVGIEYPENMIYS